MNAECVVKAWEPSSFTFSTLQTVKKCEKSCEFIKKNYEEIGGVVISIE